ncbi:MAG: HNH endonuclease [Candidatus Methanomethylophilaceae archaeon]|nr:HNH endonuclease [Candidatus Methanomethylophilaceae archaeon]
MLDAYGGSCCITGMKEPRLLRASHIKPWCESTGIERLDVRNGLCLNALHDVAFDVGLITVDPGSYCVRLSSSIEDAMDRDVYDSYFRKYDGKEIDIPKKKLAPNPEYLEYHRHNIFNKGRFYDRLEIELLN